MEALPLSASQYPQRWDGARLRPYALISGVYIFASWLTRPLNQGDTVDYVSSILRRMGGEYYAFWDSGHLLWRPLGWLVYGISSPLFAKFVGSDQRVQITLVLIVLSWLAGLASALLLLALLRLYCGHGWIPPLLVFSFVFSNAELNYSRAGTSYVPGLSLLILALYFISLEAVHPNKSVVMQVFAGLFLAGSVLLWLPYVLAVPGAIILPFASGPPDKARLRLSIGTLFSFGLSLSLVYAAALIHLRISSATGIMSWILASSHGIAVGGMSRAIFGWPRSFIVLGDAGRIIKRYLLRDPFSPVSARDLFRLWPELVKFGLFYATLFSIAVNLGRSARGRRTLAIGTLAILPVLAFAIHWQGGDVERYLPLYPVFFLVLCITLTDLIALNWTKAIAWTFVLCVVLTNAAGLRSAVVRRIQLQSENRVSALLPRLKAGSWLIVSHDHDDLLGFNRCFPFSPINRSGVLNVFPLLAPGSSNIRSWREGFASRALRSWQTGDDIWISNRVFHRTPEEDWNWVEGDDNRVSWSELAPFFSQLQYGESLGGDEGFVLLLPSPENRKFLEALSPTTP